MKRRKWNMKGITTATKSVAVAAGRNVVWRLNIRFETYVKSKDLDLWHVITNGDFQPIVQNLETKLDEVIPFEKQTDDLKKRLAKNNKAKMVIYNALPRKEYERIFMCNTAKEIWKTLLITHQELRKKFLRALHPKWRAKVTTIEESKDLTSLSLHELIGNLKVYEMIIKKDSEIVKAKVERKSIALKAKKESSDEECSTSGSEEKSRHGVSRDDKNGKGDRKCFRCGDPNHLIKECPKPPKDKNQIAFVGGSWSDSEKAYSDGGLHPKWRAKVTVIEESKDLTSLSLNELIRNLKVHDMIIKKDSKIVKAKVERKSLALKDKKESSDEECSTSGSEDKEYAMAVRDFMKFFKRRATERQEPKSLCRRLLSDSGEEDDEKDSGFSKHMMGNRKLFSTYKAYNGGNVIFGSNLRGQTCNNKCRVTFSEHDSEITKDGYSQNSKAYIILNKHTRKVEESLNVTFDETPPPSKTSPLVDDDLDEEEAIKITEKKNLENDIVDETLEIDEIINIKESRNHPLENVIGNLNQRTLRSQAQNQSNFFCFISTIEPKNVNEALGDESWIVAMQEELNQFVANDVWELVPQPRNMTIIGTKWTSLYFSFSCEYGVLIIDFSLELVPFA
ncbi:retrovirus-related pol polyprotein from transposon TNT 1-94 [Tanacetum coccineum]